MTRNWSPGEAHGPDHRNAHNMLETTSLNVKDADYGALGNGIADDTAAFAAARDAAGPGGRVWVPQGTYLLDSLDTKSSGTMWIGAGHESTILKAKAGADAVFKIGPDTVNGRYWSTYEHLTIDGNAKASDGMWMSGPAQGHLWFDVWFQNCDVCIDFRKSSPDQADKMKWINCRFRDSNVGVQYNINGTGTGSNFDTHVFMGFSFDTVLTRGIDCRSGGLQLTLINGQFQNGGGAGTFGIDSTGNNAPIYLQDIIFERLGGTDLSGGLATAKHVIFQDPVVPSGGVVFNAERCTFNANINASNNSVMFYDMLNTFGGGGTWNPTGTNCLRFKFGGSGFNGWEINHFASGSFPAFQFGGVGSAAMDTNLYRSAADTLKTDDRFVAVGGVDTRVVATASLPAAGASMDGHVLIEDAGAGDRNLIIYAGGQRFRIDGGANV